MKPELLQEKLEGLVERCEVSQDTGRLHLEGVITVLEFQALRDSVELAKRWVKEST